MLTTLIILGAIIVMATSTPPTTPSPDEIMSMIMQRYRSKDIRRAERNGLTMLNPYYTHLGNDAEEHQQLAVSLLDQICASQVEKQASLARQFSADNDKASTYMLWDAFFTGHADICAALRGSFLASADPSDFDRVVDRYVSGRTEKVLHATAEIKLEVTKAWLDESPHDASKLLGAPQ